MAYIFDFGQVVSGQYREWLLSGLVVTLKISVISMAASLALGTVVAVMRLSRVRPLVWASATFTEFFRNTPLLIQIFFWYFGSYNVLPMFVNDWLAKQDFEFACGVIALSIYTAAFVAEEIRSGVFAIPKTQLEASRACACRFSRPCATSSCPRPSESSFRR